MGKMGLMRVALATVGSQALGGVDGVLESRYDQKRASELEQVRWTEIEMPT